MAPLIRDRRLHLRSPTYVLKDAGVAQLVEQRFRKPQVARSIRVAGSITFHRKSGSYIGSARGIKGIGPPATTSKSQGPVEPTEGPRRLLLEHPAVR